MGTWYAFSLTFCIPSSLGFYISSSTTLATLTIFAFISWMNASKESNQSSEKLFFWSEKVSFRPLDVLLRRASYFGNNFAYLCRACWTDCCWILLNFSDGSMSVILKFYKALPSWLIVRIISLSICPCPGPISTKCSPSGKFFSR